MTSKAELQDRLIASQQEHLLRFWDNLTPSQQAHLASQIAAIDLDQVASLYRDEVEQSDWGLLARRALPPKAIRLAERAENSRAAFDCGEAALRAGKVGVLLVAGGQGSRLGFEHPKGMYPIGPVSGASLLQIHLEKALALGKRYDRHMPVYLMNSPVTQNEQNAFLAENDRFGVAEDDLYIFCQGTMPAVDAATGKLLLADRHELFLSPDGHGGTVAALASSGAIDHMRRRGIEQLFYLQVDNPLAPIGDREFVGYHLLAESELTSMAVAKQGPHDKVGNFALIDGKLHVIEYSDFPNEVAEERDPEGQLRFWAGSIAVHMFAVSFLERVLALRDSLPFHIARKKVSHIDAIGRLVEPTEPNALKFERFIFDLLPQASNPLVVEYAEREVFAPLKNAPGADRDTAEYVQTCMIDQQVSWLRVSGAQVADGVAVEISPLFAFDEQGVRERVEPGTVIDEAIYLVD
ncbi:MAG: UTP--glucose-1-phosphate uridylyltransferase [Pirellulales bacterium]